MFKMGFIVFPFFCCFISAGAVNQAADLFLAVRNGDLEALRSSLGEGTDVNTRNILGETPLLLAAETCRIEAAKELIAAGANVEIASKLGNTPLMAAAAKGCTDMVRLLLDAGADPRREEPKRRFNALLKAIEYGHSEIVELLLDKGADVNYRNVYGVTPLMAASQYGHARIVDLLLSRKARVNDASLIGYTALIYAVEFNQPDIALMLLNAGADVKAADIRGRTALMIAAANGQTDLVQLLVEKGAPLNAQSEKGETALTLANKKEYSDIVTFLIEKGADTTGVKIKVDSTKAVVKESTEGQKEKEPEATLTPPEPIGGMEGIQKRLKYPKKAREAGVEGEITLEVTVTRYAQIKSVKILKSFGDKECEKAAEAAVRATRWKPAKRGKKIVDGTAVVTLQFKIDKKESDKKE
ncbi:MAG: TonB family protein [candidate division KSB1 bacterium]|nr:TonB family protein [candidate division KSB1 bacterium]MDZ7345216.1 TonB family protein [candidate division KSB1 bacterium]